MKWPWEHHEDDDNTIVEATQEVSDQDSREATAARIAAERARAATEARWPEIHRVSAQLSHIDQDQFSFVVERIMGGKQP